MMSATTCLAVYTALLYCANTVLAGGANDFAILPTYGRTFQVTAPEKPSSKRCITNVMQHSFVNSIGKPYFGPVDTSRCPQTFDSVELELTVVAKGYQSDRIGFIHLDDIEVWRTSTFEPSPGGIYSVTKKDITRYRAMFRQPRTLTVDIGNVVDDTYTAALNVTLNVIFLYSTKPAVSDDQKTSGDQTQAAELVLPISAQSPSHSTNNGSLTVSAAKSTITLPRNVERAILEVYASGHGDEQFWYTHVPDDYVDIISGTTLPGNGALREIQVSIDGQLAGYVWPFPTIYAGGLSPGLWRPIAGIDAFDLMSYDLDISPFLGKLCDGRPHQITFSIVGTDEQIAKDWVVSGNVQLWLNPGNTQTVGDAPVYADANGFGSGVSESQMPNNSSGSSGDQTELSYNANRFFQVSARIKTSQAYRTVSWVQNMTFTNTQIRYGSTVQIIQRTDGHDQSTYYSRDYAYPVTVNGSYSSTNDKDFSLTASVLQGKMNHYTALTNPSWYKIDTTLNGASSYSHANGSSSSTGTTQQDYTFRSSTAGQEHVVVAAKGGRVITGTGLPVDSISSDRDHSTLSDAALDEFASSTISKTLGVKLPH